MAGSGPTGAAASVRRCGQRQHGASRAAMAGQTIREFGSCRQTASGAGEEAGQPAGGVRHRPACPGRNRRCGHWPRAARTPGCRCRCRRRAHSPCRRRNSSPWFRCRRFSPDTRSRPFGSTSCTITVTAPDSAFCCVLVESPVKLRSAPMSMPVLGEGLAERADRGHRRGRALAEARCRPSCWPGSFPAAITVTTSPTRNARASDVSETYRR